MRGAAAARRWPKLSSCADCYCRGQDEHGASQAMLIQSNGVVVNRPRTRRWSRVLSQAALKTERRSPRLWSPQPADTHDVLAASYGRAPPRKTLSRFANGCLLATQDGMGDCVTIDARRIALEVASAGSPTGIGPRSRRCTTTPPPGCSASFWRLPEIATIPRTFCRTYTSKSGAEQGASTAGKRAHHLAVCNCAIRPSTGFASMVVARR